MKYINKQRFLFLVLILTLFFTLSISYAKAVSNDISNSVFRLHIVANSDSSGDQQLKLAVRDRILTDTAHLFESTDSAHTAAQIAKEHLSEICKIAQNEIYSQGYTYKISAKVGEFAFPTKSYKDITLPSGKYTALRIEIGDAAGKNWWCVMYPPFCLTDGIISCPESSKLKLKNSLSPNEYSLVTKEDSGAIPVEIKFKIVEIFQNIF